MLKERIAEQAEARRNGLSENKNNFQTKEEYKLDVIQSMLMQGETIEFIEKTVTDAVIEFAMKNGFTAEALAWALMQ